ncbi:Cyclin-like protein [Pseudocohnilembus persalinus]|uniref:Cyclin-like protein n=1 Tax=Pseudocohnilembus persalinus TaxID=266149 RepID=A0A0V0R4D9_PSEPJ|nr:Cyclin-like protein [Pseudocohnilembus persalinus]|eukprot:KRX09080.1 Cyclin-like protein [Pseudocohnilembus persalinus]
MNTMMIQSEFQYLCNEKPEDLQKRNQTCKFMFEFGLKVARISYEQKLKSLALFHNFTAVNPISQIKDLELLGLACIYVIDKFENQNDNRDLKKFVKNYYCITENNQNNEDKVQAQQLQPSQSNKEQDINSETQNSQTQNMNLNNNNQNNTQNHNVQKTQQQQQSQDPQNVQLSKKEWLLQEKNKLFESLSTQQIQNTIKSILNYEQQILTKLNFNIDIEISHYYIEEFKKSQLFPKDQHESENISEKLTSMQNDIYRSTLCLYYEPQVIALVVIEYVQLVLNMDWKGKSDQQQKWYQIFDKQQDYNVFQDAVTDFNNFLQNIQKIQQQKQQQQQ